MDKRERRPIDVCTECGGSEREHHEFYPILLPAGCVCEWREWGCGPGEISDVCQGYMANDDPQAVCAECEHDEACHAKPEPRS